MQNTLEVNFIHVLRAHIFYKILAPKITKLKFFEIFWHQNFVPEKRAKKR